MLWKLKPAQEIHVAMVVFELWYARKIEIDNCVYLAYKHYNVHWRWQNETVKNS